MGKSFFFDVCVRYNSNSQPKISERFEDLETAMAYAKSITEIVPYYYEVFVTRHDVEVLEYVKFNGHAGE